MNNPFFDIWLNQLRENLRTNSFQKLEESIQDIGLDGLMDEDFFAHVQQADARELVILLASLGEANSDEPARYRRWLVAYQCMQGRLSVQDAAVASAKASGGQVGFYSTLFAALSSDGPEPDVRRTPAKIEELKFGISLLVLGQQSHKLMPLLKAWQSLDPTARPWLIACRTVLSRLNYKRSQNESSQLAKTLEMLLAISPEDQSDVVISVEAKLADTALKARKQSMALQSAKRLLAHGETGEARFLHIRALIQNEDFSAALEQSESLLSDLASGSIHFAADAVDQKQRFNIGHALDTLQTVTEVLEKKGMQPFLMSGTLLGFERNGTILAHDKDIDIGLIGWENQFNVAEALLETGHFYMDLSKLRGQQTHLTYAVDLRNGMAIDFFFFNEKEDHFQHGIDFDYGFTLEYRFSKFDLIRRSFGNQSFWVPSNIAENLTENYGSWEIPESNYVVTVESPAIAEPGGVAHLLCVKLELIKAIRERKPAARVKRILDHLQSNNIAALLPQTTTAVKAWAEKYSAPKSSRLKEMLAKIKARTDMPEVAAMPIKPKGPKILLVGHGYGPDGAAMMLKKTAQHWAKTLNWSIDAYAPDPQDDDELIAHGISPVRQLDVTDHQLVIFNSLLVADKALEIPIKIPKVLWIHEGETLIRHWAWSNQAWSHLFKAFNSVIFQTRWQSENLFGSFLKNFPSENIHVVPNGLDWPFEKRNNALSQPLGLSVTEPLKVVCVASLTGRKRPHDLANAILKIATSRAVQCTFIGDLTRLDTLPESFQNLVNEGHPALRFTGPLSQADIAEEFRNADVFCLPSGDESYPLAPLEAALSGLPVVQTALAPYPSIGWEHNLNCLTYPVGDEAELVKQLLRIADEPGLVARLSQAGFELANGMNFESFSNNFTSKIIHFLRNSNSKSNLELVVNPG